MHIDLRPAVTLPRAAHLRQGKSSARIPNPRHLGAVDWGGAASGVLTAVVRGVSVRTTVLPPMDIDLQTPADPQTARMLAFLKPTLIFNTIGGPVVVAPYGEASGLAKDILDWALYAGVGIAAWTGLSILAGYKLGKR